jgi:hypothetical protein
MKNAGPSVMHIMWSERGIWNTKAYMEDNIRMDLREIGWKGMDWMRVVQDRDQWWAVVNMVMNLRVP